MRLRNISTICWIATSAALVATVVIVLLRRHPEVCPHAASAATADSIGTGQVISPPEPGTPLTAEAHREAGPADVPQPPQIPHGEGGDHSLHRRFVRVVGPLALPVIGAQVQYCTSVDANDEPPRLLGTTDSNGEIELDASVQLTGALCAISSDGASSSGWYRVAPWPAGKSEILRVQLQLLAHIQGVVLGHSGLPDAQARVFVSVENQDIARPLARVPEPIQVDASGRFSMAVDAFGGSFRLTPERGSQRGPPTTLRPDAGEIVNATLSLADGYRLAGSVLTPDGRAAAGARVRMDWTPADPSTGAVLHKSVSCDSEGRFKYECSGPGIAEAFAYHAEWASGEAVSVALTEHVMSEHVTLFLDVASTIQGRIVDEVGRGVAQVEVVALHERCSACALSEQFAAERLGILQATTSDDGYFRLSPTRSGRHRYTIKCAPDPSRPKAVVELSEVAADDDSVLIIASEQALRGAVLRGVVTRSDGGHPIEQLRLSLFRWRGSYWQPQKSERIAVTDGMFEVESLVPGAEYAATIQCGGEYLPVIVPRFQASRNSPSLELMMELPAQLHVFVEDSSGQPVRGAKVEALVPDTHPAFDGYLVNVTSDDGTCVLSLWHDRYRVVASKDEQRSDEVAVSLIAGGDSVVLRLP